MYGDIEIIGSVVLIPDNMDDVVQVSALISDRYPTSVSLAATVGTLDNPQYAQPLTIPDTLVVTDNHYVKIVHRVAAAFIEGVGNYIGKPLDVITKDSIGRVLNKVTEDIQRDNHLRAVTKIEK